MSVPARRFGWPPQRCTCGDGHPWIPCPYCISHDAEPKERMATYDGVVDAPQQSSWVVTDLGDNNRSNE